MDEGPGNLAANQAAGITPVSAGYASSILASAGISDDSEDDSGDSLGLDLSDSSPLDALNSATEYLEGVSLAGLSGLAWAGIAAGLIALLVVLRPGK